LNFPPGFLEAVKAHLDWMERTADHANDAEESSEKADSQAVA
jgi:hypothetical protein